MIATADVHLHDAVVGDAQQASFLVSVEFNDEERHAVLGQALPGLDVVQLGVDQRQIFDVGVRVQHPMAGLLAQLLHEPRRQILRRVDVVGVDVDGRRLRWLLHAQEGSYARHFTVVRAVGQRAALGGQPARSHPLRVLLLVITSDPHLAVRSVSELWRHLQLDVELSLREVDFRRDFAAAQVDGHRWQCAASALLAALEQIQMQILVREPVALVSFQRELSWPAKDGKINFLNTIKVPSKLT